MLCYSNLCVHQNDKITVRVSAFSLDYKERISPTPLLGPVCDYVWHFMGHSSVSKLREPNNENAKHCLLTVDVPNKSSQQNQVYVLNVCFYVCYIFIFWGVGWLGVGGWVDTIVLHRMSIRYFLKTFPWPLGPISRLLELFTNVITCMFWYLSQTFILR